MTGNSCDRNFKKSIELIDKVISVMNHFCNLIRIKLVVKLFALTFHN